MGGDKVPVANVKIRLIVNSLYRLLFARGGLARSRIRKKKGENSSVI